MVVDDYGHHPTEIRATLAAARAAWQRPLIVVFQPHRFSRTRDLADEFAKAFEQADRVYVMDIYPAGEAPIPGITGQMMADTIRASGHPSVQWLNRDTGLITKLREELREGDILLTLGAGDVWKVGTELLESL